MWLWRRYTGCMRKMLISGGIAIGIAAIGTLFFLYSDGLISSSAANESRPATVAVPFTELARGSKSTVTTRTNYLITSASELDKLWEMIDAKGQPPVIDFTKNAVAAVFAGKDLSVSDTITISKIEDTEVRMVTVALVKPESACAPKISTTPYQVVSLPKTLLAFAHEDVVTIAPCMR